MMIERLEQSEMFRERKDTMENLSLDTKNNIKMTTSQVIAVNFDAVAEEYKKIKALSDTPSSNDALYWDDSGRIVFVEFKNGNLQKARKEIHLKIYETAFMFTDLLEITYDDMKDSIDYILVYDEQKNQKTVEKKVSQSNSFTSFSDQMFCLAGQEILLFGLEKFLLHCHKSVHSYTVPQFEAYLEKET